MPSSTVVALAVTLLVKVAVSGPTGGDPTNLFESKVLARCKCLEPELPAMIDAAVAGVGGLCGLKDIFIGSCLVDSGLEIECVRPGGLAMPLSEGDARVRAIELFARLLVA